MVDATRNDAAGDATGYAAASPWAIPPGGWKAALIRCWQEAGQDNIGLIASGVAFCGVLAMVPLLGAIVLSYGLIATPDTVIANVRSLTAIMPADAARLIGEQLAAIVTASDGKKGFGLLIALAIALYGTMKGASAMITALNIAYDEQETRGFVRLNLIALAIAVGAVVLAILAILSIAAMGALEGLFPDAPVIVLTAGKILSYAIMAAAGAGAAAALYRYAPARHHARWAWLTPGSVLATGLWLAVTLGFGFYVANFGSYDATYGSLGAAIVLLTWLYLSAYILLLGAELNCELERQTAQDTTTGAARPMGTRDAHAADTVVGEPATAAASSASPAPATAPSSFRPLPVGAGRALPSILATGGLILLHRGHRTRTGAALLAAGGAISWLTGARGHSISRIT